MLVPDTVPMGFEIKLPLLSVFQILYCSGPEVDFHATSYPLAVFSTAIGAQLPN